MEALKDLTRILEDSLEYNASYVSFITSSKIGGETPLSLRRTFSFPQAEKVLGFLLKNSPWPEPAEEDTKAGLAILVSPLLPVPHRTPGHSILLAEVSLEETNKLSP